MKNETNGLSQAWLFFAVTYAFSWLFWIPNALVARGVALPAGMEN